MKLFKNVVRLLALASLSLSISPLTTVKAADAIQVNNALGTADTTTATPTAADTTTPSADSKTSTVSVTVLSGILTLDAVPDFSFGTMMIGSTAKLASNTVDDSEFNSDSSNGQKVTAGVDGNKTGILQVTDSRNSSTDSKMPGFVLSAQMGKLQLANPSDDTSLNAILNLSSIPLVDSDNQNVSNTETPLSTMDATIDSASTDTVGKPVMKLAPDTYRAGIIKAKFNTPDSASLTIPKGQGDSSASNASSKKMNAVVTWTLSANPKVTD